MITPEQIQMEFYWVRV